MKYLCFDIESSDGGKNGSLCSFGYCIADENFNILEQDDILVNPKKPFNKRLFGTVIKLAYTEEVFRSAPKFPKVYDRIVELFDDDVTVVGFSIINDVNYLQDAIRTYRLPYISYNFYDVQLMYAIHKRETRNYSLGTAAAEFDIEFLEHRSVDDAVATLKLLSCILRSENSTFDEFISRYNIVNGKIKRGFIKNCYTDTVFADIDYSNIKIKKRLLNEFMLTVSPIRNPKLPFSHKVVCFDETLELNDISLTRNRIAKLYELGGRYTSGVESSNVFVFSDKNSNRYQFARTASEKNKRLQLISLEQFLDMLGEVPTTQFDDDAVLCASNRRRRLNRERAKMHRPKQNEKSEQPLRTEQNKSGQSDTPNNSTANKDNGERTRRKRRPRHKPAPSN